MHMCIHLCVCVCVCVCVGGGGGGGEAWWPSGQDICTEGSEIKPHQCLVFFRHAPTPQLTQL